MVPVPSCSGATSLSRRRFADGAEQAGGVLVRDRTSTAIALAIKRVSENENLRANLVMEARTRVKEMFSEETMLSRLREVYERIARVG